MSGHEILHPIHWKAAIGYANGMAATGRMIFLGGQVGWNAAQEFETDDFVGQVDQCLANIVAILAEAGARPEHLVRLTWFITDKQDYLTRLPEVGTVYRARMGRNFPAMAMVVVAGLIEPGAKVEIEATAVLPQEGD